MDDFATRMVSGILRIAGVPGGTQLNHKKLEGRTRVPVRDGDLVELAKGISGVKLVLIIPTSA